jgi:hypothetical protein
MEERSVRAPTKPNEKETTFEGMLNISDQNIRKFIKFRNSAPKSNTSTPQQLAERTSVCEEEQGAKGGRET